MLVRDGRCRHPAPSCCSHACSIGFDWHDGGRVDVAVITSAWSCGVRTMMDMCRFSFPSETKMQSGGLDSSCPGQPMDDQLITSSGGITLSCALTVDLWVAKPACVYRDYSYAMACTGPSRPHTWQCPSNETIYACRPPWTSMQTKSNQLLRCSRPQLCWL